MADANNEQEQTNAKPKRGKGKRLSGIRKGSQRLRKQMGTNGVYILPNLLTTGNLFCGYFAIIYSIKGEFLIAAYAIVAAAVFDLLDGRVARLTHATSQFGAEYDSLCDLVSFGIAPGLLLFLWALEPFGRIGWLASFFYVACGGLRLARFNVNKTIIETSYFQGLPIPMAAGIVASSVLAFSDLGLEPLNSWGLLGMTFLLGLTLVSNFRYRSFKDIDFKRRFPFKYLVLGVFFIAVIAARPEVMLFVTFMTYATLGAIFGILKLGRGSKQSPDIVDIEIRSNGNLSSAEESLDDHMDDGENRDDHHAGNMDEEEK